MCSLLIGLTTPCTLKNTQAAHLNLAYIPLYSIAHTGYWAPLHRSLLNPKSPIKW